MHVSWAEELDKAAHCRHSCCLSNAIHGRNINLPLWCVRHTFCQLAYRSDPLTDFYS